MVTLILLQIEFSEKKVVIRKTHSTKFRDRPQINFQIKVSNSSKNCFLFLQIVLNLHWKFCFRLFTSSTLQSHKSYSSRGPKTTNDLTHWNVPAKLTKEQLVDVTWNLSALFLWESNVVGWRQPRMTLNSPLSCTRLNHEVKASKLRIHWKFASHCATINDDDDDDWTDANVAWWWVKTATICCTFSIIRFYSVKVLRSFSKFQKKNDFFALCWWKFWSFSISIWWQFHYIISLCLLFVDGKWWRKVEKTLIAMKGKFSLRKFIKTDGMK